MFYPVNSNVNHHSIVTIANSSCDIKVNVAHSTQFCNLKFVKFNTCLIRSLGARSSLVLLVLKKSVVYKVFFFSFSLAQHCESQALDGATR